MLRKKHASETHAQWPRFKMFPYRQPGIGARENWFPMGSLCSSIRICNPPFSHRQPTRHQPIRTVSSPKNDAGTEGQSVVQPFPARALLCTEHGKAKISGALMGAGQGPPYRSPRVNEICAVGHAPAEHALLWAACAELPTADLLAVDRLACYTQYIAVQHGPLLNNG